MKISQLPKETQEKKEAWGMCMNGVSKPSKEKVRIFIRNTNFTEEQTWNIINTLKKKYINKLIFLVCSIKNYIEDRVQSPDELFSLDRWNTRGS